MIGLSIAEYSPAPTNGTLKLTIDEHPLRALGPIEVTLLPMVTLASEETLAIDSSPITPFLMVKVVNPPGM